MLLRITVVYEHLILFYFPELSDCKMLSTKRNVNKLIRCNGVQLTKCKYSKNEFQIPYYLLFKFLVFCGSKIFLSFVKIIVHLCVHFKIRLQKLSLFRTTFKHVFFLNQNQHNCSMNQMFPTYPSNRNFTFAFKNFLEMNGTAPYLHCCYKL